MYARLSLAAICFAAITPSHAGELVPYGAESLALGSFRGVVYYLVAPDGYKLRATIADGDSGLPVRFEATLADKQQVVISVPRKVGEPSVDITIVRRGEKITLTGPQVSDRKNESVSDRQTAAE